MYAGGVTTACGVSTADNDNSTDIPEWKKILIMKRRAGCSPGADEHARRNPDSGGVNIVRNGVSEGNAVGVNNKFLSGNRPAKVVELDFREISPPKTVTIGNINVELRSVKSVENPVSLPEVPERKTTCEPDSKSELDRCEDLQYGPGIVDRLRARFLNIGVKQQRKPVVRRFSSLENLPGSQSGPYRVNTRGVKQNGFKSGYAGSGNVKKAQSMETLLCTTPEQQVFAAARRPNARTIGGVKARILSRNVTPISVFTDENDKPKEKSPSPAVSPRFFTKSVRRWDYGRSVSAPNINEDELPKPDTVKLVKKIFESPPSSNCSEKSSGCAATQRFRKIPSATTPSCAASPHLACSNGVMTGSEVRPAVKKVSEEDAKPTCAKECPVSDVSQIPPTPDSDEERYDDFEINGRAAESAGESSDNSLSANRSCETAVVAQESAVSPSLEDRLCHPTPEREENKTDACGGELFPALLESLIKVTPEQLPPTEECHTHSDALFQGRRLEESSRAELSQDIAAASHPLAATGVQSGTEDEMVVAAASAAASSGGESSATDSFPPKKGAPTWQKPPQSTTSIVFDFRGRKDVEPHISLNPAPFGCRPAKVSRSSMPKRSGSPPRSPVNGIESKDFLVEDDHRNNEEEDWDEMDIGADLPAISGIVFTGENVKIGRGSLLEKRCKKLNIQFDDKATSTFEYPSENTSPSPGEENGCWSDSSFNSAIAIGSAANSRLGLSNYTPQVLSSNKEFELGVSQSNHRPTSISPDKIEHIEDVPIMDAIIPADPEDTGVWSATETTDILF